MKELAGKAQLWKPLRRLFEKSVARIVLVGFSSACIGFGQALVMVIVTTAVVTAAGGADMLPSSIRLPGSAARLSLAGALVIAIVLLVVLLGFAILNAFVSGSISMSVLSRMRKNLFSSFAAAGWPTQNKERDGHLQELLITCATQSAVAVQNATLFLASLVSLLGLLISALIINGMVTVIVMASLLGIAVAVRPLSIMARRLSAATAEANLELTTVINQRVNLAQEIIAFDVPEEMRGRFESVTDRISLLALKSFVIGRTAPALYREGALILLLGLLAAFTAYGFAKVAELAAVILILVRALSYAQAIQSATQQLHNSLPWTEKAWEKQAVYEAARLSREGASLEGIDTIEMRNVCYSYQPGYPVLKQISFSVIRGESIGIIGPSGSGKSTLVQTLLRLRVPDAGRYLINEREAGDFRNSDWFRRIAYMPQEPRVFGGTVTENIAFFRNGISQDQIERAARLAHIHDDIMTWPLGYQTSLGDRSGFISGGQRQRLVIARALVYDPDLLIFDEPTSALDPVSEALFQATIASLKGEVTLFIVAHRLSTLKLCDRIMVIDTGVVTAIDSPEILARTSHYFQEATRLSGTSGDEKLIERTHI